MSIPTTVAVEIGYGCGWANIGLVVVGLIFLSIRSPYKISEPYDNPLWSFEERYQFCVVIFRFCVVKFRFRVVIFQFRVVIFQNKCNDNSGLPKLLHWLHALPSDQ